MNTPYKDSRGFTLLELLIVMALSAIVMTGIYQVFAAQQAAHTSQSRVTNMQQNIRAALYLMEREIRMAGYDPNNIGGFGFEEARQGFIRVHMDLNENSTNDAGEEEISFGFNPGDDGDVDGVVDGGDVADFRREAEGGGLQTMAQNIQAVAFGYGFDNNDDGQLDESGGNVVWGYDSDGDGDLDTNGETGAALASEIPISDIRAVRLTILARTATIIKDAHDTRTYTVGDNSITVDDNYQRRIMTTTIKCRNLML